MYMEPISNPMPKKPLSRLESTQQLISNPPPLPIIDMVTLEPQVLELANRVFNIIKDPVLTNKLKILLHKKIDSNIHKIDLELNKHGGGETFFTKEECSFF